MSKRLASFSISLPKGLLLFVLLGLWGQANTMVIDANFSRASTAPYEEVYIDNDARYDAHTLLDIPFGSSQGEIMGKALKVYSRVTLTNDSDTTRQLFLLNARSGIDYITVYVHDKTMQLRQTIALGDQIPQSQKAYVGRNNDFALTLAPHETHTLIFAYHSMGPIHTPWDVFDADTYDRYYDKQTLFWGIYIGIILALLIYNVVLYTTLNEAVIVLYLVHAVSILLFQLALYGVLYALDLGVPLFFIEFCAWIVSELSMAFMLLFTYKFFAIDAHSRLGRVVVGYVTILLGYTSVLSLFAFFPSVLLSVKYTLFFNGLITLTLLIWMLSDAIKKRKTGAIPFAIGQFLYNIFPILQILYQYHLFPFLWAGSFFSALGLLFELIFVSIALHTKVRAIAQESQKMRIVEQENSKYIAVGKAIQNVSHQWKKPLNSLVNTITLMQVRLDFEYPQVAQNFTQQYGVIDKTVTHLRETLDAFLDFFHDTNTTESFNVTTVLNDVALIQNLNSLQNPILYSHSLPNPLILNARKKRFVQVVMTIIENAIDALKASPNVSKILRVEHRIEGNMLILEFYNSGKSIDISPIESIFEYGRTSKEGGFGLGLFIARTTARETLGGDITVRNVADGVVFTLTIKQ